MVARTAVDLDKKLAEPLDPNIVPEAPAPKADPMSAPFPFCNRINTTIIIAIITWNTNNREFISFIIYFLSYIIYLSELINI